jgi:hypothetical protein
MRVPLTCSAKAAIEAHRVLGSAGEVRLDFAHCRQPPLLLGGAGAGRNAHGALHAATRQDPSVRHARARSVRRHAHLLACRKRRFVLNVP